MIYQCLHSFGMKSGEYKSNSIMASAQIFFRVFLFWCFLAGSLCDAQKPNLEGILNRRQDVYIAGFFPFGRGVDQSSLGRGVMPSVKLALDHVNEHSGVLRNYRLHMWWNDTECNAAVGVKSFFDMMHSGPHKLMLFGAACTHVTDPIAKASKHWHLTQLSYADTHPMFTKDSFPNFFRIVPSENAFNLPRLALLRQFNWTRVGTVYQNEPRYSLAHNRLVADLDLHGFQVVETQSFATEVRSALEKLKEKDVRIILGNFNESWAVQVFCEAYKLEMFGRAYQWLIMGTYSDQWWTKHEDMRASCNESDVAASLEAAILTDLLPLSTTGDITISGITASEYKVEYDSRRGLEYSRFHGYTYDGIWAVALAIQHVAQRVKHLRKNKTVVDFKYRDPEWERLFLEALRNISFEGVTGPVRFYDNERKASILLKQFQTEGEVKVGEYCSELNRLDFSMGEPMRWIGRYPPKDRTLHIIEHSQVNITIYAVLASCSVVGIILATFFLIINITYRNQRYIKMSSPHLNNLIIIGCILTYMSVIFLGLDSGLSSIGAFPYICTARAWLLMAGFSLAFGAMFSKTWRVHSIFTDVKLNKKVIKDYQLFMVVGVLLAIDLAIMTTWQISDPFYRETKQMDPSPHPSSEDIIIIRENEYCQSERMTIFVGVIYAYKGLLMIFGAFLAWETRNVSIPALNDSKHVGLSVYNVVIMCVMGAPIALVLADHKDAVFILISIFIIFCTTATLCLVFVPKLVELRRNKSAAQSGDKGRIRATLRPVGGTKSASGNHSPPPAELERRLREQRATNSRYRKALQAKESELQMLMGKLGADVPAPPVKGSAQPTPNPQKLGVPTLLAPKDNPSQMGLWSRSREKRGTPTNPINVKMAIQRYPEIIKDSALTITALPPTQVSVKRTKEVSVVSASQSSQGDSQGANLELPPPKKEPGPTKNVSFKNHTDSSPVNKGHCEPREPMQGNRGGYGEQIPSNTFRGHAEVLSSNGSRPVLEKDQLAKSPYGWRQEEILPQQTKQAPVQIPPAKQPVAQTPSHRRSIPEQQQQQVIQETPRQQAPPQQAPHQTKSHRRTSSIGQPALLADMVLQRQATIGGEEVIQDVKNPVDVAMRESATVQRKMNDDELELDIEMTAAEKRRLCQRRDSEKRKSNFIVAQSDLWDTNTFSYTCPAKQQSHHHSPIQRSVSERSQRHGHAHGQQPPTPPSYSSRDQASTPGSCQSGGNTSQRTTPERKSSNASAHFGSGHDISNHHEVHEVALPPEPKHPKRHEVVAPPTEVDTISKKQQQQQNAAYKHQLQLFTQPARAPPAGQQPQQRVSTPGSHGRRSMTHHLSTPDVHNKKSRGQDRHSSRSGEGGGSSGSSAIPGSTRARMHAASSESELFECAILPIFQKLLSERHRSQPHGLDLPYGLSCPNISIKCDIVEYL